MEISKGSIRIENKQNIAPTDIEAIGLGLDGYVIVKYKLANKIQYVQYAPDRKIQTYVFFELLNNSPLWSISYDIVPHVGWNASIFYFDIKFILKVEPTLINDYINTSLALNFIIIDLYSLAPNFSDTDFTNKSLIPYYEPVKPPSDFKMKLYDYQQRTLAKMLQMENNQTNFTVNYTFNINFKGIDLLFDPVSNCRVNKELTFKIKTTGGILSDEMGLGKTISSIALIVSNPAPKDILNTKLSTISNIDKINSRATIVLCPSHLTKQWESEIKRCNPKLKVLTILTKNDYNGLTFSNFIDSDIIITSHQFIMNFKFYPTLHYQTCTASSFNFENRNTIVKQYLSDKISKVGFPAIKELDQPIFEFFNFHRLILDEGHEIFGEILGTAALGRYMSQWVSNIDANFYWYVSGTPFINYIGVKNCAKFINLKLEDTERDLVFDYSNSNTSSTPYSQGYAHNYNSHLLMNFMNKEYIWNNIMNKICIRHRKVDVESQIKIHGYQETIVWLRFTDIERQLYDAKKGKVSDQYLQQLCCHPLIVESVKKIFGDVEVDLSVMQDKLIDYHKNNYETYKLKLSKLDPTRQEYHMLKKSFETQMSESKYLFTILEKMKEPNIIDEENCSICMDCLDNPTLTACGHLFCYDCLKMCLGDKKRCPMCKTDLTGKDLLVMNLKKEEKLEETNPLIQKYGSKLGKLISIIRHLVAQDNTRIIVFSQWDDMLNLVGKTLAENEIENCFVKGNVWSRNSAIRKFKAGKNNEGNDNKVIMLSLKNAASGTNLTEATHIFFIEPINASKEESHVIECQAIARACRIGQKKKIMLLRVLIENTIEEEIYRKNYNKDAIVSFEEQNYMIEQSEVELAESTDLSELSELAESSELSDLETIKVKVTKPKVKRVIKPKVKAEVHIEI
jgi:SNF2 family DNA or RNA helicase